MALAVDKAIEKSLTIKKGYKGLCLQFVRTCFDIPAKYPSAADAWANAKDRVITSSTSGIPKGAPVFFSIPGNRYGHVAVYLGDGKFRTNYSAKGTVITASLDQAVFRGMRMLGWSRDLNGVKIPELGKGGTASDKDIAAWQKSMNKVFPSYANFAVDGKFGPYSAAVTREFQTRVGIKRTGKLDADTKKHMRKYGVNI